MTVQIRNGDLREPQVIALLERHVERARAETAPGSAHALDLRALEDAAISFWSAWEAHTLLGVAALKRLSRERGEVKSMHTVEDARRRGVASALLQRLIREARALGLKNLSLETGSWDYFEPARAFYRRHGFRDCRPFADYRADPNSVFMTREL
jgi:putative acetyltransferase